MSSSKFVKSSFNNDWMDSSLNPEFSSWIREVPKDPFSAHYILCKKNFSLRNMGKTAVRSHAESKKHKQISKPKSISILNFVSSNSENASTSSNTASTSSNSASSSSPGTLSNFVLKEKCLRAEIIWALQLVKSHSSFYAFDNAAEVFAHMYDDCSTAQKNTLGRAKMSYLVSYGLAPHFSNELKNSLTDCNFVICFDEAMNSVAQRCQMDLIVRYWCKESNRVCSRYLTSTFLGRATAEELHKKFKEAIDYLNIKLLLQISMDGPNVNLKFLKHLKSELQSNNNSQILELGTCGLHIVHGAFQYGHKQTDWKLDSLLRALHNLFKYSPSRRASFIDLTGTSEFPLKFCATRWVENLSVSERALKVFENIKKYVEHNSKCLPDTLTCEVLMLACKDKLILAKIAFFAYLANILEPFLKKYQAEKPMIPFLYQDYSSVIRQMMKIILKNEVFENCSNSLSKMSSIDLEDSKNLRCKKQIDTGIVASRYLHKNSPTEQQRMQFLSDCQIFVKSVIKKIFERTEKNYNILRAVSSLNPNLIKTNSLLSEKRMNNLLELLFTCEKISAAGAERAKVQFQLLLEKSANEYKEKFQSFSEEERLDDFYSAILNNDPFSDIFKVVKLVLTLSHGNASVESGFSVNKDMLVENLKEESLIALRTVYDAIKYHGGVTKVPLSKELFSYAKSARMRYHDALENKKKMNKADEEAANNKRAISQQITSLQKKKMKLLSDKAVELAELDNQISELKKITK